MKRYFQWLVGDDRGKVVEFVDITQEDGEYFYNFDDGESCNMSYICAATNDKNMLKGKAMVEVSGPYNAWRFEEIKTRNFTTAKDEHIEVPPLEDVLGQSKDGNVESAVGTMRLIAPKTNPIKGMPLPSVQEYLRELKTEKYTIPNASGVDTEVILNKTEESKSESPEISETPKTNKEDVIEGIPADDPVYILVKTCKKHDTEITMTVNIDLPSKSIYEFAKSEFENGDEKFINILAELIKIDNITDAIKNALNDAYKN